MSPFTRGTPEKLADEGIRTLDLRFTKPLLYQLSYVGTLGIIKEGLAEYQLLVDFSEYILLNDPKNSFIPVTPFVYTDGACWMSNSTSLDIAWFYWLSDSIPVA